MTTSGSTATAEQRGAVGDATKYLTPRACLNEACSFVCVGGKGWKNITNHMATCPVRKRRVGTDGERARSVEKARQIIFEKMRNNVDLRAIPRHVDGAKNMVAVSVPSSFACMGTGCLFGFHSWEFMSYHMKECRLVPGRKANQKRGTECTARAQEVELMPWIVFQSVVKKQVDDGPRLARNSQQDIQVSSDSPFNLYDARGLTCRCKSGGKKGKVRLGSFLPSIKLVFVYSKFRKSRDKRKERVEPNQGLINRLTNEHWNLAFYEHEYLRKTSGYSRGDRKRLREDKTWQDFAAEPPLILTRHANERLVERGVGSIPRFVPGTYRTVVATMVPNRNPQGQKGWKRYLACLRFRSERFHRKHEATNKLRKRATRKKRVQKHVKKGTCMRVKHQKSLSMKKGLPFGSLPTNWLDETSQRIRPPPPRNFSTRSTRPAARILKTYKSPAKKGKGKRGSETGTGKKRMHNKAYEHKSDKKTNARENNKNNEKPANNFACLGRKCSFCCEDWNVMTPHLQTCAVYGAGSAKGKMKQSQKEAVRRNNQSAKKKRQDAPSNNSAPKGKVVKSSGKGSSSNTLLFSGRGSTKAPPKKKSGSKTKPMASSRCITFGPPPRVIDYSKLLQQTRAKAPSRVQQQQVQTSGTAKEEKNGSTVKKNPKKKKKKKKKKKPKTVSAPSMSVSTNVLPPPEESLFELSVLSPRRRRTKVTIGSDKKAQLWQAIDAHMMRSKANL